MSDGPSNRPPLSWPSGCPYCGSPVRPYSDVCGTCALPLQDARAARIDAIGLAVADSDRRRAALLAERNELLSQHTPRLPAGYPGQAGPPGHAAGPGAAPAFGPGREVRRPEVRRRDTQATLLGLGGMLLALAALVFAAVTWQHSGPAGRAALLLTVSSAIVGSPWLLLRRGLRDTAETMAAVGASMLAVDALLLRHLVAPGIDGRSFWAATTVLLTAAFVGYGRVTGLASPVVIAAVTAQAPVLLTAARFAHSGQNVAGWLALAVAIDGLAVRLLRGREADSVPRRVVAIAGASLWGLGVCIAVATIVREWDDSAATLVATVDLLAFAGVLGVFATLSVRWTAEAATGAVLLTAGALLTGLANGLHVDSAVGAGALVAAGALATMALAGVLTGPWRDGAWRTATVALAVAVVALAPVIAGAVHNQIAYAASAPLASGHRLLLVAAVSGAAAGALLVTRHVGGSWTTWPAYSSGAVAALVLALPVEFTSSPAQLALLTSVAGAVVAGLAIALVAGAPGARRIHDVSVSVALAIGVALTAYAAVIVRHDDSHLAVALAATTAVAGIAALRGVQRVAMVALVTVSAGGAAASGWLAAGHPHVPAGLVVLVVPVVVGIALVADDRFLASGSGRRSAFHPVVVAAEASAVAVAVGAVASVADVAHSWLPWALAVAGLAVLAQALRPTRLQAWYAGVALLTLSSWTQLGADDVHAVEAYSLPVSAVVLAVGYYRRRLDPRTSSLSAYGSGLSG
ncbi:MAG: hypothetical protein QOI42_211, partial [Frankiaceae bacterium]|nr:hypothetical protein [Frankiaceae bacterium]